METARGVEYGRVVSGPKEVKDEEVVQPLEVCDTHSDRAGQKDGGVKTGRRKRRHLRFAWKRSRKHGLEMKLIDAEYTFDNNKVLFYFTADGRIDFRELVKDLAAVFRTRIELRQIGVQR